MMMPAFRVNRISSTLLFSISNFLIPGSLITGVDVAFTEFLHGRIVR